MVVFFELIQDHKNVSMMIKIPQKLDFSHSSYNISSYKYIQNLLTLLSNCLLELLSLYKYYQHRTIFIEKISLSVMLLSHFSRVRLCATPWTAAYQAPPSMGFSRQEYWSGLPLPSPVLSVILGYISKTITIFKALDVVVI